MPQTFKRRERVVADNWGDNPAVWSKVNKVLKRLDIPGMSSDESDDEHVMTPTVNPRPQKRIRRVRLPWLNPEISDLFAAVETYDNRTTLQERFLRRGNLPLYRDPVAKRTDSKRQPLLGLPRNWYDDDWFRGLGRLDQRLMNAATEEPIPVLVCIDFPSSQVACLTTESSL
jgi:hypothetical protein